MLELLAAITLQSAECSQAAIAPAEQRMSAAIRINDADAALTEVARIIAACGTSPLSYNARFYGGLLERERGNIQEAAVLFSALPRDNAEFFYPVVNWVIVQAAAMRGDADTFHSERDLLRETYGQALVVSGENGPRGRFIERFDVGGVYVDAFEILRARPDNMQRYLFLFVPGPDDYLQAVSFGGYANTRRTSDSLATEDMLAQGPLWHGDLYDCHGHQTLTMFRAEAPDYETIRETARRRIARSAEIPAEHIPARICAFDHFITPYVDE